MKKDSHDGAGRTVSAAASTKPALGTVSINTTMRDYARAVIEAETDDFVALIKCAGLDPFKGDLRFSNWSDICFDGCDLRGFDFTGCRLVGCTFDGAQIDGARFDGADIKNSTLRTARDWDIYSSRWVPLHESLSCRHLREGSVFQDAPFAPEMVVLPRGSFYFGSPDGSGGDQGDVAEQGRTVDEGRRRKVEISHRFAIGRFAVTFGEFSAFIAATDYAMPESMQTYEYRKVETRPGRGWDNPGFPQTERHPVVGVRWADAVAYGDWLTTLLGQEYRLPSEVEWEYAARAGSTTAFWWGNGIKGGQANFDTRHEYRKRHRKFGRSGTTVPVDKYDPNPWGIFQVHGNVWEWCDNPYDQDSSAVAEVEQGGSMQSVRGGSWRTEARNCRSANRSKEAKHSNSIGFRILRAVTN